MSEFIKDLNDIQQQAVLCTEGPVMVIAGAGSGKTRVLTYKVAHLLKKGVDSFHILSLTFTNKAAREMKNRIIGLVGASEAKNVWMGTFHSIFARILRFEGERLGYPANFSIYDTEDSKTLIKQIIKDLELDDKTYQPNYVLARISGSKTNLISSKEYINNAEILQHDKAAGKPRLAEIFSLYDQRLFRASAMDFDDLLFKTNILLRDFPEVLFKYQQQFKYILVDEYQDTNYAQYLIIKKLAAKNENICVVGDDAQSIYAFRGANIKNILNLKNDYPDMKIFKLEQNYRSTKNIVCAANSVIANNKDQIFKEIWTSNEEGEKIKLIKSATDNEEGHLVAQSIFEQKMQFQLHNSDFVILYRTNAQSRAMEEALRKLNIPYKIFGGLSFYKRKEIKDLLAYFRLSINQRDEEALWRVINYPNRKIGKTTQEKMMAVAGEKNMSPWELIENIKSLNFGAAGEKIDEFGTMIKSFAVMQKSKDAFITAQHIAKSCGILKDLSEDASPEGVARIQNLEALLNGIKEFSEENKENENEEPNQKMLQEYMQNIALLTDSDDPEKEDGDFVSLMTIHAAKGLEFPHVYIVGVEENLFPSNQSISSRSDLEEERRLFYVALTRAMTRVTISFSETRYKWGNLNFCEPSRFLEEINPLYIEFPRKKASFQDDIVLNTEKNKKQKTSSSTKATFSVKKNLVPINKAIHTTTHSSFQHTENILETLQIGMNVAHERFGNGKVIQIEGNALDKKAMVFFEGVGQKQLLLKYAKLKILP